MRENRDRTDSTPNLPRRKFLRSSIALAAMPVAIALGGLMDSVLGSTNIAYASSISDSERVQRDDEDRVHAELEKKFPVLFIPYNRDQLVAKDGKTGQEFAEERWEMARLQKADRILSSFAPEFIAPDTGIPPEILAQNPQVGKLKIGLGRFSFVDFHDSVSRNGVQLSSRFLDNSDEQFNRAAWAHIITTRNNERGIILDPNKVDIEPDATKAARLSSESYKGVQRIFGGSIEKPDYKIYEWALGQRTELLKQGKWEDSLDDGYNFLARLARALTDMYPRRMPGLLVEQAILQGPQFEAVLRRTLPIEVFSDDQIAQVTGFTYAGLLYMPNPYPAANLGTGSE